MKKSAQPDNLSADTMRPQTDWLLRLPPFLRTFLVRGYVLTRQARDVLTFLFIDVLALALVGRDKTDAGAIVVIKNDSIGDYVLFRNFFAAIKSHPDHREKRIVFCGSAAVLEMAQAFDRAWIDVFIPVERTTGEMSLRARFRLLRRLKRLGAAAVFHPSFVRDFLRTDALVRAVGAPSRIGWKVPPPPRLWSRKTGWVRWSSPLLQRWGDRFYTRLLPSPARWIFEFERHRLFFQAVLPGCSLPGRTHLVPLPAELPPLPARFALLMPGAGFAIKEWPVESYGRAARHLSGRHGLGLVIAGRARDREKARRIGEIAGVVPIDLTGRLGLVQLVALVARAALVLGNDSAGIHLAAALDRKGIAVSGGTALIEFHPYPEAMHPTVRFVYPRIIREAESYRAYADGNLTGGRIPVSEVEVEAVVQAIDALLA